MEDDPYSIEPAVTAEALGEVDRLFAEYGDWLRTDLAFETGEEEPAGLPGEYAPPAGAILIARASGGVAVGCVALRPLDERNACEMKHLYVRPSARSAGLGRRLALAAMTTAVALGYSRMRLDTLPPMTAAQAMYRSLGFERTPAYHADPAPGMIFMARDI